MYTVLGLFAMFAPDLFSVVLFDTPPVGGEGGLLRLIGVTLGLIGSLKPQSSLPQPHPPQAVAQTAVVGYGTNDAPDDVVPSA